MLNSSFSFSGIYCDTEMKEDVRGDGLNHSSGEEEEAGNVMLSRPIAALVVCITVK